MLDRSIPFYSETQAMALDLATRFVQPNSRASDLGCSTGGNVLLGLAERVPDTLVKLIAVK